MVGTPQLRVSLAGRVAVENGGMPVDEERFPGRQGRLLFAYLVAEQGRAVPRAELAEALWGETPPPTADKALAVIVSKLRGLLATEGVDGAHALTGAFGCYRLELPEGSWVDVLAAASAVEDAERALAAGNPDAAKAAAGPAEVLLRRPFLPGEDAAWVEEKRHEYAELRLRALDVLADACLRSAEAKQAARWAEHAVALAPFREDGYRKLMEAHVAAGNRGEALRVHEQCRRLLAEELGAYPSPETEALYRELLAAPSRASPAEPPRVATPLRPQRPRRRALLVAALVAAALAAATAATLATRGGGATIRPESLVKIDAATGKIRSVVPVGRDPGEVEAVGRWVFVTSLVDKSLYRVSRSDGSVTSSGAYAAGRSLARQDGGHLWVVSPTNGVMRLADAASLQYSAGDSIRLPVAQVPGFGPVYPAVTVGGGSVWVAERGDHEVSRWRHRVLAPARLVHRYGLGDEDYPLGAAFGDGAAWFGLGSWANTVLRIDAASGKTKRISVGSWPTKPAYGFGSVWVPMFLDDTIWRLDPGGKPQAIIKVGHRPWSVAVGDGAVWVADHCDGTIKQIDPAKDTVVRTIHTGYHPQWLTTVGGDVWVGIAGTEFKGKMSCGSKSTL